MREDYERHKAEYTTPETRRIEQIVFADKPAAEAKNQFESEGRDRWMFDRDEEREDGRILNRSFSGTYER